MSIKPDDLECDFLKYPIQSQGMYYFKLLVYTRKKLVQSLKFLLKNPFSIGFNSLSGIKK